MSLANVLRQKGDLAGAVAESRKMIETRPSYGRGHSHLGSLLQEQGDFAGAEAEYRKAIDLAPKDIGPPENLAIIKKDAEAKLALVQKLAALRAKLDDAVADRVAPASPAEAADFALLCSQPFLGRYAAAARFYAQAFLGDRKLADDLATSRRYNAACYAALAGCGQGTDAPAEPAERGACAHKPWRGFAPSSPRGPSRRPPTNPPTGGRPSTSARGGSMTATWPACVPDRVSLTCPPASNRPGRPFGPRSARRSPLPRSPWPPRGRGRNPERAHGARIGLRAPFTSARPSRWDARSERILRGCGHTRSRRR